MLCKSEIGVSLVFQMIHSVLRTPLLTTRLEDGLSISTLKAKQTNGLKTWKKKDHVRS